MFSVTQVVEQWTSNPKAAGSNPVGRQVFCLACFYVVAVLVALPSASTLVAFWPDQRKALKKQQLRSHFFRTTGS